MVKGVGCFPAKRANGLCLHVDETFPRTAALFFVSRRPE